MCQEAHIEHRLIPPRHPQTNGMVERFNGRIAEILRSERFDSSADLKQTLENYQWAYNHQIPQRALGHVSPIQALKEWQKKRPDLFVKRVYNITGLDTYGLMEGIRRLALKGTKLARAQVTTIRLKLLKVGAVILRNTRRVRFLLSSAYPHQQLFLKVAARLRPHMTPPECCPGTLTNNGGKGEVCPASGNLVPKHPPVPLWPLRMA